MHVTVTYYLTAMYVLHISHSLLDCLSACFSSSEVLYIHLLAMGYTTLHYTTLHNDQQMDGTLTKSNLRVRTLVYWIVKLRQTNHVSKQDVNIWCTSIDHIPTTPQSVFNNSSIALQSIYNHHFPIARQSLFNHTIIIIITNIMLYRIFDGKIP